MSLMPMGIRGYRNSGHRQFPRNVNCVAVHLCVFLFPFVLVKHFDHEFKDLHTIDYVKKTLIYRTNCNIELQYKKKTSIAFFVKNSGFD